MNANYMVGIISYLPENERGLTRISLHREQLDWLEQLAPKVRDEFQVYRVESAWGPTADKELQTTLPLTPIRVGKQAPGANRNLLLKKLYESDYDWLFILDDDRVFYPHYRYQDWFDDLNTPAVLDLCKRGYIVSCILPMYEPFKKANYDWPFHETHWNMCKDPIKGSLQSCFIPNVKKYHGVEVYFDNDSYAQIDELPEDTKFQLDWIKAGFHCIRNKELIAKEVGQSSGELSSLYESLEHRRQVEEGHPAWFDAYLKELYPKNPSVWTRRSFLSRYNPEFRELIPRTNHYVFEDYDLPRNVLKAKEG